MERASGSERWSRRMDVVIRQSSMGPCSVIFSLVEEAAIYFDECQIGNNHKQTQSYIDADYFITIYLRQRPHMTFG